MSRPIRSALTIARQNFRTLGLDLPSDLKDDLAKVTDALNDRDHLTVSDADVAEAVTAVLLAGKDPAKDVGVRDLLVRRQLREMNIDARLNDVIEARSGAVLAKHADALIETLAEVVAMADLTIAEARESMSNLDLTNAGYVTRLRPEQMTLWGRAREASERVSKVEQVWSLLVLALDLAYLPGDMKPLALADLSAEALAALGHAPKAQTVIEAGHRLSLATPATFTERVARVQGERAKAAEAQAGRTHDAQTRHLRHG